MHASSIFLVFESETLDFTSVEKNDEFVLQKVSNVELWICIQPFAHSAHSQAHRKVSKVFNRCDSIVCDTEPFQVPGQAGHVECATEGCVLDRKDSQICRKRSCIDSARQLLSKEVDGRNVRWQYCEMDFTAQVNVVAVPLDEMYRLLFYITRNNLPRACVVRITLELSP